MPTITITLTEEQYALLARVTDYLKTLQAAQSSRLGQELVPLPLEQVAANELWISLQEWHKRQMVG